jgi:VWFA-related protein
VDNRGQPVTDLKADDFQITDAGKPQTVSFFRVNQANSRREPLSAIGPDELSNRVGDQSPGATVILFDLLNLGFGARGMATSQLEHDLPQIETADSLYLYVLTVDGRLLPVHDIRPPTAPGEQPLSMSEPASAPWTRRTKPMLDNVMRAVAQVRSVEIDVFTRILVTFHALETLGARAAAIPGRKNVIWVTDGVPFELGEMRSDTGEPIDFTPEIRKLSEALDRSYIALYPVRQIMMGRSDNIGATSDGNGATGGGGTGMSEIATLDLFADLTGGRRSTDKAIGAVIQQSMRDLNFSYQLGYFPPSSNWDNKFHKLRITTQRKGLRTRLKPAITPGSSRPGPGRTTLSRPPPMQRSMLRKSVCEPQYRPTPHTLVGRSSRFASMPRIFRSFRKETITKVNCGS